MTIDLNKEQINEIFASGAVGIDLGTTYSAVAAINEAGRVEVLTNSEGTLITPSVVLFDEDGSTIVGEQARLIGQGQSDRVVECVKRVIGQPGMDYEIDGKTYTPEGISAIILGKLIKDAAERLGRPVKSAVITVPAWFNDDARQATQRAGKAAGLNVLGILSEPTAAALAYGVQGTEARTALVYDLGGGTFDVSVIRISEDGQIDELARDGDVLLGGKDWDERIIERVCDAWATDNGEELPPESDAFLTLSVEAERAKKRLTDGNQARLFLQHEGGKLTFKLTRDEFNEWTTDLTARTAETVRTVLDQAGLSQDEIDVCLPVGGSTRMPAVRDLLETLFPGRVDHTVEKDQVVAIGACLYMAKKLLDMKESLPPSEASPEDDGTNLAFLPGDLQDNLRRTNVIQVSSRSYGLAVLDGSGRLFNDHFIRTNQRLPLTDEKTYYTAAPNQQTAEVQLLEGDSRGVDECKEVAKRACSLPPGLPHNSPLHCRFTFTEEGMITIHIAEPKSGHEIELTHAGAVMTPEEQEAVSSAIRVLE